MLQRVSFSIGGKELVGVLHLPDAEPAGAALVLHGFGGHPDQPHIVEAAAGLASAGVAAYRFPYRDHQPPKMSLATALEDAEAAVELLAAHPQVEAKKLAVVGFSFGGAVAALLAGRERRTRAAVLGAATSRRDGYLDPVSVLAKTKARVLLIWGAKDTEVATIHADRFATALTKASVVHEFVSLEGADHDFGPASCRAQMAARVASWVRESFTD